MGAGCEDSQGGTPRRRPLDCPIPGHPSENAPTYIAPTGLAEREDKGDVSTAAVPPWPSILSGNGAILAAALSVFLVAMRLYSVAHYDMSTAYGILQASGTGTVLVGVALSSAGELIALAAVVCGLLYNHKFRKNGDFVRRNLTMGILIVLCVVAIFSSPLMFLVFAAIFLVSEFIFHRPSRLKVAFTLKNGFSLANVIYVLWLLFGFALNTASWLPVQEIGVAAGKPIVGYVLSNSQPFTAILQANNGKIVYIPTSTISSMEICDYGGGWMNETLPELTTPRRYPVCPQSQPVQRPAPRPSALAERVRHAPELGRVS